MKYSVCFLCVLSITILISCRSKSNQKIARTDYIKSVADSTDHGFVEIVAKDFKFQIPDTLPSGWVAIRFRNEGKQTHFFMFNKLPQGVSYQDYLKEIATPFGNVWTALKDSGISKQEATNRLMSDLPKWVSDIHTIGGSGLIAPGRTSDIILKLIPGNYEMECYVKTPGGAFHGALGMVNHIIVTKDSTNISPPEADIHLSLIDHHIKSEGDLTSGRHIVAVHFMEDAPFGMGDDVHLVKLDKTTDFNKVVEWMDWMNLHGLESPAPATFLGGVQEMPKGNTGYFTVDLKPGRYAWISESYASAGMVQQFTIE